MYFAYLPAVCEGRYGFQDRFGEDAALPLFITADRGRWLLQSPGEVQFSRREQVLTERSVALEPRMLLGVAVPGARYDLMTEEEEEGDFAFLPYALPDTDREITIGRAADSDIYYENGNVSRHHAVLRLSGGRLSIRDAGSVNGTYVNGLRVTEQALVPGDSVYIMGLYLLIGAGFVSVNNLNGRCQIAPEVLRALGGSGRYAALPAERPSGALFNRQPRRKYALEPEPIEIAAPPMPMNGSKMPLMMRLASPLLMGGRSLATGNYLMALSSMALPMMTQGFSEKDQQAYEDYRKTKYLAYLQGKEQALREERDGEKKALNELYPPLGEVLNHAYDKKRLWEYRDVDPDFLSLRLGTGSIPLKAKVQYPQAEFDLEEDVLKDSVRELLRQDFSVPDAPVMLSLKDSFITGVTGTAPHVRRLMGNLAAQLALTHSYDEVKLIWLARPEDAGELREELALFRYLPHCWDNLRDIRFVAESKEDALVIGEYLRKRAEDKLLGPDSREKERGVAYVIFALSRELLACMEVLKEIIGAGSYTGVSIVTGFDPPLKESAVLLRMNKRTGTRMDMNASDRNDQPFLLERCDGEQLGKSLRQVMRTRLQVDGRSYTLPKTYTFLEMFGVGKVEYLNPLTRWKEHNPIKSLAAPVGIGTDGKVFWLDLHEKRQGPHGLIAGTTGSGKSEFIITYILAMAVNYSPEEVAFVLIDYKGGGLTTAFEDPERGLHLPHVAGTITNLDGSTIQRSLTSITSELERRQRLFNEAASANNEGKMEIYGYQRLYREGKVKEPLPHLFLIADEFAELKKQEPEFMAALISTARIGRSLGVHLILATQKPGGVVSDEIWTNTKFRVCLKVADRSDSMDMLKRPEAAELKETGRFYLQVGYNEYFAMGQSAWCGAEYMAEEEIESQADEAVDFLDNAGQVMLSCKPHVVRKGTGVSQLVAIVRHLSDLAKERGLSARPLWLPTLPERLDLAGAEADREHMRPAEESILATIGTMDDPKHQTRLPLQLDLLSFHHMLVCGLAGSGKSTLLRTMLYTLCRDYGPDQLQFYILDLSGGAMSPMKRLPHCGAYVTEGQELELERLMDMLREIIAERKKLFREVDVTNFNACLQVRKLPLILLVMDSYTNIQSFPQGVAFNNEFFRFLRDAAPYGVHVIASVNHQGEIHSKARMEVDYRIALQAKDRYDYTDILETRTLMTAPEVAGRGLCVYEDVVLEYQVAMPDAALESQERTAALHERVRELSEKWAARKPARRLPHIDEEESYAEFCRQFDPGRIPLGYNRQDSKPVAMPFAQLHKAAAYFGNPRGVRPVLSNLFYAAGREGMKITILRRQAGSLLLSRGDGELLSELKEEPEIYETTKEGVEQFYSDFVDEIVRRNAFRDEYCEAHGIPNTDKSRILKAAGYLREKTQPWLILIESVADLCLAGADPDIMAELPKFLAGTKGYNLYFFGLFYPEDYETVNGNALVRAFCQEQFLLMFGGRFDRCVMTSPMPSEIRSTTQVAERPDRFMMKYRDAFHSMHMPCGGVVLAQQDPDELSIV